MFIPGECNRPPAGFCSSDHNPLSSAIQPHCPLIQPSFSELTYEVKMADIVKILLKLGQKTCTALYWLTLPCHHRRLSDGSSMISPWWIHADYPWWLCFLLQAWWWPPEWHVLSPFQGWSWLAGCFLGLPCLFWRWEGHWPSSKHQALLFAMTFSDVFKWLSNNLCQLLSHPWVHPTRSMDFGC